MSKKVKLVGICFTIILVTSGYSQQQTLQISPDNVAEIGTAFTSIIDAADSVDQGQNDESPVQTADTRIVSIYTGIGFPELVVLGVQYQFNDKFALGAKADIVYGIGVDWGEGGGGLKGSYFFSRTGNKALSINVLNIEASYHPTPEGDAISFGANIGHDSIEGKGIGFLWLIGISRVGLPDEEGRAQIFPDLKIGLHLNI